MLDNTIMTQPLLFLEAGSTLVLERLEVVGAANPAVGAVALPSSLEVRTRHRAGCRANLCAQLNQ